MRRGLAVYFGLLALALVVYLPALHGTPVFDDAIVFTDKNITDASSPWTWWASLKHADYWPITYTVFWSMYQVFGDDPLGYHVVNVALHVLDAVLVGMVLRRLGTIAWPGVLLFLLHPVQVESVAYMFQLKTILATTFALGAVLAYLRYDAERRRTWLALSLVAFALSLLSKTSTAMLPAVIGLHLWWARRPLRDARVVLPYVAIAAFIAGLTLYVNARNYENYPVWDAGLVERVLTAAWNTWFYLGKLLVPYELAAVYPRIASSPAELTSWAWLAAALAVTVAVAWWSRRPAGRVAALGLGWFVLNLAPALGFVNVYYMKYSLVADHYQYLASIGVLALASPFYAWASRASAGGTRLVRAAPAIIVGLLLLGCAMTSWRRAHSFADARTFWNAQRVASPDSALARNNWGVELSFAYDLDGAIRELEQAIAIDPRYDDAHFNLGLMLEAKGDVAGAEREYRRTLEITPDYVKALDALARMTAADGRHAESEVFKARAQAAR